MLATRQGALLLAILCAAGAAGILMFALSSYKQQVTATPKVAPQATVLVATGAIQKGTSGDQVASGRLYKSTPIVASQLAPGAIGNASALAGTVAKADILPGQQLTTSDFGVAVGAVSLLAPDQRAISIPADETHSDLDVVAPGDRVDLYAELPQNGSQVISLLVPDVLVLKTPASAVLGAAGTAIKAASTTAPAGGGSLVLAVGSSIAPSVALTADTGKLWVILRPAQATKTSSGITTEGDVLSNSASLGSSAANSNANTTTTGRHK